MSGQDPPSSDSSRLPSDYSSELHRAVPALVSSGGSVRSETTPMTSSSSEPGMPRHASPGPPDRMMRAAPRTPPSEVPDPVRQSGDAEAELRRRLADHDRRQRDGTRERSRGHRDRAQHHSISTPTPSRPATPRRSSPPRSTPVAPPTQHDCVYDLHGGGV